MRSTALGVDAAWVGGIWFVGSAINGGASI